MAAVWRIGRLAIRKPGFEFRYVWFKKQTKISCVDKLVGTKFKNRSSVTSAKNYKPRSNEDLNLN